MTAMTIDQKIEFFFEEPTSEKHPENFSSLHLLKRHVKICLGIDPEHDNVSTWPAAMAILTGIDMLGKYYAGSINTGDSKRRFTTFFKKYFESYQDKAEIIYQLRNSVVHSYSLYSKTLTKTYKFAVLFDETSQFIDEKNLDTETRYIVNLSALYDEFQKATDKYSNDLKKCENLQNNFEIVFDQIGMIVSFPDPAPSKTDDAIPNDGNIIVPLSGSALGDSNSSR